MALSERVARNDKNYDPKIHGPKNMLPFRIFGNFFWQGDGFPIIWDKNGKQETKDKYGMVYNTVQEEIAWHNSWMNSRYAEGSEANIEYKKEKSTALNIGLGFSNIGQLSNV